MSNLEMYMGGEESFGSHGHPPIRSEEDDPGPDYSVEEPPSDWQREDASNEGSNVSGMDSSGNWYMGQMKGKDKVSLCLVGNSLRSHCNLRRNCKYLTKGMQ